MTFNANRKQKARFSSLIGMPCLCETGSDSLTDTLWVAVTSRDARQTARSSPCVGTLVFGFGGVDLLPASCIVLK